MFNCVLKISLFKVNRDDRQTTLARSTTPSPPPATSTPVSSLPLRSQLVTSTPYISSPTTPGSSPSSPTPSPYNIVDGLGFDYADALEGFEAVKLKAGSHRGSIFGEGAKVKKNKFKSSTLKNKLVLVVVF